MERMNRRIEKNKNRNHNGNQNEKRHRKRSRGNMKAENARISAVRLYLHYISIHIRSAMQYKTSFFLTTLGQFLFSFNVFMGITFMMVTNRLAIVTGMPTIHAIRKYYGPVAAGFVGIALFMACLFFTMGNISGTGAGVNLITGLNWKVGSALMIAVVIYCYFTKNVYSKVEKIITACILGMIVAFYATLIGVGGPDWGETGKAFVSFQILAGGLATALAFISTKNL